MEIKNLQTAFFYPISSFNQNISDVVSSSRMKIIAIAVIALGLLAAAWIAVRFFGSYQAEKRKDAIRDLSAALQAVKAGDEKSVEKGVQAFEAFAKRKFKAIKSDEIVALETKFKELQDNPNKVISLLEKGNLEEAGKEAGKLETLINESKLDEYANEFGKIADQLDGIVKNNKLQFTENQNDADIIKIAEEFLSLCTVLVEGQKGAKQFQDDEMRMQSKIDQFT